MKKGMIAFFCLLATVGLNPANSSSVITPVTQFPSPAWLEMNARDFIKLSAKDFDGISGKKLSLKERIAFSVMKKNMKHSLKKNPSLTVGEYLTAGHQKMKAGAWIAIILGGILIILIVAGQFMLGGS